MGSYRYLHWSPEILALSISKVARVLSIEPLSTTKTSTSPPGISTCANDAIVRPSAASRLRVGMIIETSMIHHFHESTDTGFE